MSDDANEDTLPPSAPPSDLVENLFGIFEALGDVVGELRKDERPPEVFVRWKLVDGGIEILSCTTFELLDPPCGEGEFQGKFR